MVRITQHFIESEAEADDYIAALFKVTTDMATVKEQAKIRIMNQDIRQYFIRKAESFLERGPSP